MSETPQFRCDECDAPAVFIEPGSEEVRELFLLERGRPTRCWCFAHWMAAFPPRRQEQVS